MKKTVALTRTALTLLVCALFVTAPGFSAPPKTMQDKTTVSKPTAKSADKAVETPPPPPRMTPLEATITTSQYLPAEMYGQWSVTATLVEANAQNFFNPLIYEIWVLEQSGDRVTISNPTTGASASVNVDKVVENTATFHRIQYANPQERVVEIPTITVDGNIIHGQTINQYEIFKNGVLAKGFYARYHLTAERIKPSRIQFGRNEAPAEFEIERVQRETR